MSVAIVMGSDSDLSAMQGAIDMLNRFGVDHIVRCVSAHRDPHGMLEFASQAASNGIDAIIAGAGGAAHLPGMIASATELPVIGVPVGRPAFDGLDALLSIVQMPAGIPVATMAVDGSANAALFAIRILARSDEGLRTQLRNYAAELKDVVAEKNARLQG
ncbi:MAG: 5-(carboxyamino)imidazole ribonucleotide mutase [Actinobacteria bacterium]|nr:5-(carboxyamino)imidazole ribonucleotide mutase [Actinomycetota bacterium]